MGKTKLKNFTIPITEEHDRIFEKTAKKVGLPKTSWARNALLKASGII